MASAPAAPPLQLDARAWEQCVSNLHRELGRIASREDCQDAVQEALADALRQPGLSVENLGGWVLVIARRRLLDQPPRRGRARQGRAHSAARSSPPRPTTSPSSASARPSSSSCSRTAPRARPSEAMARLSAEHQRLLTLALERTRYPEVAEILGISPKAAKERTLRAWGALRQAFIETERGPECATVRRHAGAPRARAARVGAERAALADRAPRDVRAVPRLREAHEGPDRDQPGADAAVLAAAACCASSSCSPARPDPRSVETAAANALTSGNAGSGSRGCSPRSAPARPPPACAPPSSSAPEPDRAHAARAARRARRRPSPSPAPTATPTPTPTATPTRDADARASGRDARDETRSASPATSRRDTRSVSAPRAGRGARRARRARASSPPAAAARARDTAARQLRRPEGANFGPSDL